MTQLGALGCDRYRITLKSRCEGSGTVNYGNQSAKVRARTGREEHFWSRSEIISDKMIRSLAVENMEGCDVYITPISVERHYLVVDDVTQERLVALQGAGGYTPALIQRSSDNNMQCILIAAKQPGGAEQSAANALVVRINREYGDTNFCGVVHPFRLAGFFNKKPGKDDTETVVLKANSIFCLQAESELAAIRKARPVPAFPTRGGAAGVSDFESADIITDPDVLAAFLQFRADVERFVLSRGWTPDNSKIDLRAAINMHAVGFGVPAIAGAILAGSPDISARHSDTALYALMTAQRAGMRG